jgi:hypothetical protein
MTSKGKGLTVEVRPQVLDTKTGEIKLLEKEKWYVPLTEAFETPPTAKDEDIEVPPTPVLRIFPYPESDLTNQHLYVKSYEKKGIRVVNSDVVIQGLRTLERYLAATSFPDLESNEEFAMKNLKLKVFFARLLNALIVQELDYQKARYRRKQRRQEKAELVLYTQLQDARLRWDGRTHGRYPQALNLRWC